MKLKNMKVRTSLLMGYAITIVISLALLITTIFQMNGASNDYGQLLDQVVESDLQITTARLYANVAARDLRDILLIPDDPDNTQIAADVREDIEKMHAAQDALKAAWPEGVDATKVNTYLAASETWESIATEILGLYEKYAATGEQSYVDRAVDMILDECTPALENLAECATAVKTSTTSMKEDGITQTQKGIRSVTILIIVAIVVASIVVLSYAFVSIRNITAPVSEVERALMGFSEGNFDIPVEFDGENELGNMARALRASQEGLRSIVEEMSYLLGEMAQGNFALRFKDESVYKGGMIPMREAVRDINHRLSDTMAQITMSAEQVSAGSEQVSTGAQALAQGATEQASAVEELSATITEISNNAQNNAKSSDEALSKTNYVSSQMDESAHNMNEMVAAMDNISQSSQEIGRIIATIENIAFQTNILALNAAVEAARAGSAGKGFAVVADEVRNLATKSDEAAKATKELIDRAIQAVGVGNEIVEKVSDSLKKTVDSTEELKHSISGIAKAIEEEADAIAQVTEGIDQISSVVQTNSATSEESAAASEELSGQATLIKELMNKFTLRNEGAATSSGAASAATPTYQNDDYQSYDAGAANSYAKY